MAYEAIVSGLRSERDTLASRADANDATIALLTADVRELEAIRKTPWYQYEWLTEQALWMTEDEK